MALVCELAGVTKSYRGGHTVLSSVSLGIEVGEMVAIVGPSGSGKSTILNVIGLLESWDSGEVSLFGKAAPRVRSSQAERYLRNRLGYLFQNYALIDNETVRYNLRLAQSYAPGAPLDKRKRRMEILQRVGLESSGRRKVYELSGGEQQRLAIARLMLKPCELILADEPTGSLDPENRNLVLAMLHELNAAGKTVVVVTHDPEVAAHCGRVINIRDVSGGDVQGRSGCNET